MADGKPKRKPASQNYELARAQAVGKLRREHGAMLERLRETEEVRTNEQGELYWTASGDPVDPGEGGARGKG